MGCNNNNHLLLCTFRCNLPGNQSRQTLDVKVTPTLQGNIFACAKKFKFGHTLRRGPLQTSFFSICGCRGISSSRHLRNRPRTSIEKARTRLMVFIVYRYVYNFCLEQCQLWRHKSAILLNALCKGRLFVIDSWGVWYKSKTYVIAFLSVLFLYFSHLMRLHLERVYHSFMPIRNLFMLQVMSLTLRLEFPCNLVFYKTNLKSYVFNWIFWNMINNFFILSCFNP